MSAVRGWWVQQLSFGTLGGYHLSEGGRGRDDTDRSPPMCPLGECDGLKARWPQETHWPEDERCVLGAVVMVEGRCRLEDRGRISVCCHHLFNQGPPSPPPQSRGIALTNYFKLAFVVHLICFMLTYFCSHLLTFTQMLHFELQIFSISISKLEK